MEGLWELYILYSEGGSQQRASEAGWLRGRCDSLPADEGREALPVLLHMP